MNATIDLADDSSGYWVPTQEQLDHWVEQLFAWLGDDQPYSICLRLVDEQEGAALNAQYRHKDYATNVLSFPADVPESIYEQMDFIPLGDIVICPAVVSREASEQNKQESSHWAHLLLHGILHLLGYSHDDEANAARMERLEIDTLQKLGLPNPYLVG